MKYKGFYKKDIHTRIEILKQDDKYDESLDIALSSNIYDHLIENAISVFEIPLGLVPKVMINQKDYTIPMATEESSVIAAANHGSKIINQNGGVSAYVKSSLLRGEIIFANPNNKQKLIEYIEMNHSLLIELSKEAHPSIVKRGGGVKDIKIRDLNKFLIVDVLMDTQEAMGANMMNTVLEALASHLTQSTGETVLMAILSNHNPESLVSANVKINPNSLKGGMNTAKKIALSSELAHIDPYRCATHNKGVMNGIDAVVLASGNDTRAVNAGIYTYHSKRPFTHWKLEDDFLHGEITIPLTIGTVGGAISVHPKAKLFKKISHYENKHNLMEIIASIGLIQNFAALYALNTDGIQKGHMSLHAKNILLSINCPEEILEQATRELLNSKTINTETAKAIVKKLLA